MKPILSIVIVEYKSLNEISACVQSIAGRMSIPYEIVVSSNSCYTQEERNKIPQYADNVHFVFNERNGGFAYAMNNGLRQAHGDFLVIMNSDCSINFDLAEMVSFMQKHTEVGVVGPCIHDAEGNLQDTARPYVSVPRFILRQTKRMLMQKVSVLNPMMDYTKTQTVDWVIGAFMMVSRKAYELTHGLDDSYFMYAEDLDWCTRIRQKGLEVVYYAKSDITYKGTRRARNNKAYARIFLRSHFLFWKKFGFIGGYPKRKKITYQ